MKCPCCSNESYENCCKPYHQGRLPLTPLELMRSRFSAYALEFADYIMLTTHSSHPDCRLKKNIWKKQILEFCKHTKFLDLTILEVIPGEKEAFVTFHAHLEQQNQDVSFTEKSRFIKADDRWYYVDGILN